MSYVKIIHQIWYNLGNGNTIPEKYKKYQQSWINHHQNWKYILWNESTGDKLIQDYYPQYYNLYKNVKYPIMKIDILRYCILELYGGLYADIDYKCLSNFEDYIEKNNQYELFFNETPKALLKNNYCNSLIISTKQYHPFWKILIKESFNRIQNYYDIYHIYYVLKTTGPGLISDVITNLKENNIKLYNKINILPFDQFNFCNSCQVCSPSKNKKLYAVHDYVSYWNSNIWLKFRKLFTCTSPVILILLILCIFNILKKLKEKIERMK